MPYKKLAPHTLRVLETVPNMYLILSPDLYILTASDVYLEATETTRAAIVGKHIFEAFPADPEFPDADGVENINASLQEVLRTKKPHYMPIQRYDVPDKNHPGKFIQRYWDPSHTPVFGEDGEIEYIIQLATNVTEKVLAEQAWEEAKVQHQQTQNDLRDLNEELEKKIYSERHFRQLADLVPAKISNALPSGEVTFFNKQWLDYSGLSFEDMRDFGYYSMMHPDEIENFQNGLQDAALKGVPYESEMRFRNKKGDYRWHLNIASPVLDENGEITMWVGSTTDIQRIKEEEQRKSDFIGMVSHELKTPLTSLSAYLQVLQIKANKAAAGDSFESSAVNQAVKQTKKMTSMINGFLNVSRLEANKIYLEKKQFDVNELLKETKEEMSLLTTTHQVTFESCEPLLISADRDKIGHVLNNIIDNACKYSNVGSKIHVACKRDNDCVILSVTDEGVGIKEEDLSRLFERYYRVESSSTISGFGIGLYLCAEIVKLHQGEIWVESETGKGSTFSFSLPLTT